MTTGTPRPGRVVAGQLWLRTTPWLPLPVPTAPSLAAPGNVAAPASEPPKTPLLSADHAVPFQRRISACSGPPLMLGRLVPTAYTSLPDRAATPVSSVSAPGVGLGTMLHVVPFQCSISALRPAAEA